MFGQPPIQRKSQQPFSQPQQQQRVQRGSQHIWGVRHLANAIDSYEDWVRHGGSFIYSVLNQVKVRFVQSKPGLGVLPSMVLHVAVFYLLCPAVWRE